MPYVAVTAHAAHLALVAGLMALTLPAIAAAQSTAEIDRQVWQAVAASAANHDIVAMGRVYHPAAVLVSNSATTPIAAALERWGKDMVTASMAKVATRL